MPRSLAKCSARSPHSSKVKLILTRSVAVRFHCVLETALAMCDSHVSILDEFPLHEWHGPTACADWWKALNAYYEKEGIAAGAAALGTPWTVDVAGDRAYFVAPATYEYKQHGKPVKESHAVFTVALRRTDAGWRITSWTWSKH